MKRLEQNMPFKFLISCEKLFLHYENLLNSEDDYTAYKAKYIVDIAKKYPILKDGFDDIALLEELKEPLNVVLRDIFAPTLSSNEMKIAATPLQEVVLYSSDRFNSILEYAGPGFELEIRNMFEVDKYIFGCCAILKSYYKVNVDLARPLYYDIPDKNGIMRNYRITYNGDFIDIQPTDKAIMLTEDMISELLNNYDDIEVWKKYFPRESYIGKGFVISNMFDVTLDNAISELKTNLLALDKSNKLFANNFKEIFKSMFGIPDIKLGFTLYNEEDQSFEKLPFDGVKSMIVCEDNHYDCHSALCDEAYDAIVVRNKYYAVSNIPKAYAERPNVGPFKTLLDGGVKSAILAPISNDGKLLGTIEIGSPRIIELNTINANKLDDVIPYLVVTILRSEAEDKNLIEVIIQQECTSIHESVFWKFEKEAKRFLRDVSAGKSTSFQEIVFEDVFPLYGQIDIKDSSVSRNESTKKDLLIQLNLLNKIFDEVAKQESLPIYDEIKYRIKTFISGLREEYHNDSEQVILDFLQEEIDPVLEHLEVLSSNLNELVRNYHDTLNENGVVYKYRRDYDTSIGTINKVMASIIDEKQVEAQKMFPHYFERYKTDGVEHTMYIGKSIANDKKFSELYLNNLRLWQLQVMCDMENEFYRLQPELAFKMKAASLILVHSTTISIRFRLDEHKFDVDGTYNARYEVIKKRLDKSLIKGTNERVTQEGKMAIVYGSKKDEHEYMRYVKLLQVQKYISENVEIVELESLQGVSGLKAIRVELLYTSKDRLNQYFTLNELSDIKTKETIKTFRLG
ncbi:hypothetical protein NBRC110019_04800 [Neptunitalea chrysea]|uniref:GAF domain-containing protein n=1 Tax=Neptunitalea chrysea TaxID=1647581 RepID=A0A9W6EUA0_9FLAO|nr:GAF domain-containing protein [Neptunitalea chrysea]GLB51441.1 hypothetical protein NBRC110019_04800 [Neptunitalea chrysea]